MSTQFNKSLIAALSFLFFITMSSVSHAAENPFGMSDLATDQIQMAEKSSKCGEGKCGGSDKAKAKCGEGKCGGSDKAKAKCGEGKCGGSDKAKAKCGESKCGGGDKKKSKCGEGKCGG
jgi:uncharacterized low-complexity protein